MRNDIARTGEDTFSTSWYLEQHDFYRSGGGRYACSSIHSGRLCVLDQEDMTEAMEHLSRRFGLHILPWDPGNPHIGVMCRHCGGLDTFWKSQRRTRIACINCGRVTERVPARDGGGFRRVASQAYGFYI
ncbi:MAG: hypothetical protein F4103_07235 [Boseongicola sp. SB0673_bin_14]|nr:hypothetical protein [Boseongicola sp. SB0673_bin_14]